MNAVLEYMNDNHIPDIKNKLNEKNILRLLE